MGSPVRRLGYDAARAPIGLTLRFVLLSTWGDPHYIGLNGIEVYDTAHRRVDLAGRLHAVPHSITGDARTPDKLLDGVNNTWDGKHMWLAPFDMNLPGKDRDNVIHVVLDRAVPFSLIKFWNYSKTAARGVREMMVFVDDALVSCLELAAAPNGGDCAAEFGQCLWFGPTDIRRQVDSNHHEAGDQAVLCYNDGQLIGPSTLRPGNQDVIAPTLERPTTSWRGH